MAHGIQYVQATQFFELPSSSARGVPELRNKKCLNPNLTCGTRIWGRSQLWNKNIPNMIKGYFADIEAILHDLRTKLRKGAKLYINVANSAYGNKTCEVDVIIAKIAQQQGYTPIEIREVRQVKSSRQQKEIDKLRESIIVIER